MIIPYGINPIIYLKKKEWKRIGYCFNNKLHRLKLKIFSKLMNEPDFDELQEVFIHKSDI